MPSTITNRFSILSDDSSFYGNDDEKARLENEAAAYDPEPYWSYYHPRLLSTMQQELPAPESKPDVVMSDQEPSSSNCNLPPNRRGPNESIPAFLARVPPSSTLKSQAGDWIWMRGSAATNLSKSLESRDEARFIREGTELIRAFAANKSELDAENDKAGKTKIALSRKLTPLRKELEKNILELATETGVTAGKWMFFPSVQNVDKIWGTIVTALEKGVVCADAKVATGDGSDKSRLICVYNQDFGDKKDVKKVLQMLADEGLFDPQGRPIFYKCDAYTLLDITSGNDWGLKASMYSSKEFKL